MARGNFPSARQDQFVLRLPDGLRDRIKAYAERHGRSMNAEILRVLEREFPPAWTVAGRVGQMIDMLRILRAGAGDEHVERLALELQETVEGIISGRVSGVDEVMRDRIVGLYKDMQEREAEDADDLYSLDYDDEELRAMELIGRPEKYPIPPNGRRTVGDLSEEEFEFFKMGYEAGRDARDDVEVRDLTAKGD